LTVKVGTMRHRRCTGRQWALMDKVEHPDRLVTINYLALVLHNQGKYEEAEKMYRQRLALKEKVLSKERPDTLLSPYCLTLPCRARPLCRGYHFVSKGMQTLQRHPQSAITQLHRHGANII
jgi:hypothetical protein